MALPTCRRNDADFALELRTYANDEARGQNVPDASAVIVSLICILRCWERQ